MLPTLTIDGGDPLPPYEQLRRQLGTLIESGELAVGDRLPPLRQLAGDLGLAVGTVARAYRELEAAGLVQARRGGGTRVAVSAPVLTADQRADQLHALADDYLRAAARLGFDQQDAQAAVHTGGRRNVPGGPSAHAEPGNSPTPR